ncbi:MSMEG_1061 family FMN-dependent PPOX-type flavoprotein [Actinospongicola halichondriae]|uniref:MSMEG_1061 family FMN-dependent PPOX-type flavoprotein n=1 Tax=Actinospongicola halichondriae TaxID=3236844 RepID=UPI003D3D1173
MNATPSSDPHAVTSDEELEELIGAPDARVQMKLRTEIDDTAREFIERSPFVVVATCDADGRLDASPKGDPAGFVRVIDATTIAIPERKGNSLGFGPRNVLATGRIGLIFMVPGQRETYRVNGAARLTRDPELLDHLAVDGRPALMATVVTVEEAFFHCGKAMIRSKLWATPDESEADRNPIAEQFAGLLGDGDLVPVIAADLEQNYRDDLY